MPRYIALLRGINVGGRKLLAMSDLRQLLGSLDLTEVSSILQSGNLIFRAEGATGSSFERWLEQAIQQRFDARVDCFVRTCSQWRHVVEQNPFPTEAKRDPGHLLAMFFKHAPAPKSVDRLRLGIKGPEVIRAEGRQLYLVYPAGIGTSKLTNTVIEKSLGMRGTSRNWNTILKLAARTAV